MIVGDAINRIDEVLNEKPLSESKVNNIPKDNGITLEHVSYSYKVNDSEGGREGGLGRTSMPENAGKIKEKGGNQP